ncbi:MAG: ribose 5-phosphate isomerase B [Clostridiales bacterium]|nr:ribose 5-phosphate isomerase B [Clostridiales bacterium]
MKIAVACDPAGVVLKDAVMETLKELGAEATYLGIHDNDTTRDYPVFALRAAKAVAAKEYDRGIVICGTGVGISIAANKVKGIRCCCCSDCYSAKMTRAHNDANMLAIGGRVIAPETAKMIVEIFMTTEFEGGRHQRRVDQITAIENGQELE